MARRYKVGDRAEVQVFGNNTWPVLATVVGVHRRMTLAGTREMFYDVEWDGRRSFDVPAERFDGNIKYLPR